MRGSGNALSETASGFGEYLDAYALTGRQGSKWNTDLIDLAAQFAFKSNRDFI